MRAAAIQARRRIAEYSSEEVATIMFSFPLEVSWSGGDIEDPAVIQQTIN